MTAAALTPPVDDRPLVVDLDGTLIRTDILFESALHFLRHKPARLHRPLLRLAKGRAAFKAALAEEVTIDVAALPYDPQVLAFLRAEKDAGRTLILATATDMRVARAICDHLQLFDDCLATGDGVNLKGPVKRDLLIQRYGEHGFDYAGNSLADVPVWKAARHAHVANASPRTRRLAEKTGKVGQVFDPPSASLKDWVRAMRVHQWAKNVLIFLPLLAAHRFTDVAALGQTLLAFLLFGLTASATYIINDVFDLADDRVHPTKCRRPLAAGRIGAPTGLAFAIFLLAGALVAAPLLLGFAFSAALIVYTATTLAYSLHFKRIAVVDVVVLACLYCMRLVAGSAVTAIPLSFWLLALSMFAFFSLAVAKRYAELSAKLAAGGGAARGRGYRVEDLPVLGAMGGGAGLIAVLVLALYINDDRTRMLYSSPTLIWLVCPLALYWFGRIWLVTARGEMNEDPVVYALRDRASYIVAALAALVFLAAR